MTSARKYALLSTTGPKVTDSGREVSIEAGTEVFLFAVVPPWGKRIRRSIRLLRGFLARDCRAFVAVSDGKTWGSGSGSSPWPVLSVKNSRGSDESGRNVTENAELSANEAYPTTRCRAR